MVAEREPSFRRMALLVQYNVLATYLCITPLLNNHSHRLLQHLHPNTSVLALYTHFVELLQSTQSILGF